MASHQLILCPQDWRQPATAATGPLVEVLRGLGFAGEAFVRGETTCYRAGRRFFEHITFLGCSPVVAFDGPGANGDFCYLELEQRVEPLFVGGENVKEPRCRACGHRLREWRPVIAEWEKDRNGYQWCCPSCGGNASPGDLNWRQCAGFGHLFLRIWGVFEAEAVPGEQLLRALQTCTQAPWHFFYFRF